ncbi:GerAB/ArcD/ProY family transporter [Evansella tamaricis]|uniref:Spore germination protein n=1 Tax=Evansella tamaricis TaxID=2069301 RepID=A0ABS6JB04_9BACI|nr:GerAB/ArcD/ProY family transporter [Evansella tamaricis]MBU9710364.1 spore germination protein [Evansella tamaricis]
MEEKIHYSQVAIMIYMIQSAVTLFNIPRIVAEGFGTNGWLVILPLSFICLVNILLINLVYKKGNGEGAIQILEGTLPKWVVYPIYVVMIGFFSLIAVMVAKHYMFIIQAYMFPQSSPNLLLAIYLLFCFYLLTKGIYNISKIIVVFFFMTVWTVALLVVALPEISLLRYTPYLFKGGSDPIAKGMEAYVAFLGYELILFVFPYIEKGPKVTKAIIGGASYLHNYLFRSVLCQLWLL